MRRPRRSTALRGVSVGFAPCCWRWARLGSCAAPLGLRCFSCSSKSECECECGVGGARDDRYAAWQIGARRVVQWWCMSSQVSSEVSSRFAKNSSAPGQRAEMHPSWKLCGQRSQHTSSPSCLHSAHMSSLRSRSSGSTVETAAGAEGGAHSCVAVLSAVERVQLSARAAGCGRVAASSRLVCGGSWLAHSSGRLWYRLHQGVCVLRPCCLFRCRWRAVNRSPQSWQRGCLELPRTDGSSGPRGTHITHTHTRTNTTQ
jgi:hypothetical protein